MFIIKYSKENEKTNVIDPCVQDMGFTNLESVSRALDNAIKNRELEINLYWHRAAYFWVFISIVWGVYGKVLVDMGLLKNGFLFNERQTCIVFIISCVGTCLSLAWFYVNKGSKHWLENWENQIDYLEKTIMGPSYKTLLQNKIEDQKTNRTKRFIVNSAPYSVSKINQYISYWNLLLWLFISIWNLSYFVTTIVKANLFMRELPLVLIVIICFLLSIRFAWFLLHHCRSDRQGHGVIRRRRAIYKPTLVDDVKNRDNPSKPCC